MSLLHQITPVVITYNEEDNLARTLGQLGWAPAVIVVDSFSTDRTLAICATFPNVRVVQRKFDHPSAQLNHGLSLATTEWVMALGADYVLTDEIVAEIGQLAPDPGVVSAIARFKYCIGGRPLRASLYPDREIMFRARAGRYVEDGHTERLQIAGRSDRLKHWVHHDDRKPLSRWLWAQDRYAILETGKLLAAAHHSLPIQDRLRRWLLPAPAAVFFYTLFLKGLVFEGWRGWYYVLQRTLAEMILSLRLIEAKLKTTDDGPQEH